MKEEFDIAASRATGEIALRALGIAYEVRDDGTLYAPGSIDLKGRKLDGLPDLSLVHVSGNFDCSFNDLGTLKGAPYLVDGDFNCYRGGLTSLKGAPRMVNGQFLCDMNLLTTLEGAPPFVGTHFYCMENTLVSLHGAPGYVGKVFACNDNPLKYLEGVPKTFSKLTSNLGCFFSYEAIPRHILLSPETLARQAEDAITKATVLQSPLTVRKPLKISTKPLI
jgi:hypothetical protein